MAFPVTSFEPAAQGIRLVPDGWLDTGKVRGNLFRAADGSRSRLLLHVDYGGFVNSQEIATIDDGGSVPGLLVAALNNGWNVLTLEVNEGGASYLAGIGSGLLLEDDDANFLNPGRPNAAKDVWGVLGLLKHRGQQLVGVDVSGGLALSSSSASGIVGGWAAMANRGGGRYPDLETDPALALDSRVNCHLFRIPSFRFRTHQTTVTGAAFPDLVTDPTGETAAATLADASTAHKDAWSMLLVSNNYTAADHEQMARCWLYTYANSAPGSTQYLQTVSGDFANGVDPLHTMQQPRMWKTHWGYTRCRVVAGTVPTLNTAIDDIQVTDPEPADGSSSDMLDYLLAHGKGAPPR